MTSPFTIGIEEEFQLVDRQTGQLSPGPGIQAVLEHGQATFGEQIKAEMLQPTIELISEILPDIPTARKEMQAARAPLARLVGEKGLALVSAGTHPTALWQDQLRTPHERYEELEDEYQDVARAILIYGLHVHIGVENQDKAVTLINQLRTWLPHLLALSSNSPFWKGRFTGIKSYRQVVWQSGAPRTSLPEIIPSLDDYNTYIENLMATNCITSGKDIWWDIRPHSVYSTIEFRICDMPATVEDSLALAALCQALVAKLLWL